ncbi:BCCT family transporter [Halomarina salina]|uniref:BCCT family transporter n=1 Tax=Halomarina salina TaxID=1872699 RepID=A0ABD5RNP3_9EURY|nr:BCCT family transporter [Halomarina salina]
MSGSEAGETGGVLAGVLLPLCIGSGAVVVAGFFFPEFVGDAVDGHVWLVVALTFFGSGLGYLAVLPHAATAGEEHRPPALLRIRRHSVRVTLGEFLARHDPVVLGVPVAVFALFCASQALFPGATTAVVDGVSNTVLLGGGPLFLGAMFLAVCYCLVLLVGPWGDVRLGAPDAEPTYTYPTYFTLVFTAGIAAGVVVWGPAEALFHYRTPPPTVDAQPQSAAAIDGALTYVLFHWGLSAWSAYAVIGLPIAYFVFRHDAPLRVSTILAPFLGVDGLDSLWGRLVDTLAVFATIGGIATSVALVSEQFLAGITFQWGVTTGRTGSVVFIAGLTLVVLLSCVTGVHRGIRRIAALTVALFALFALVVFVVGPRSFVVSRGLDAVGAYALGFVPLSLTLGDGWVTDWTVWNWSWWFSWAPFAGLFVAALSRGRRIRTVVVTSVVATSAATMVWFLLLGGTSLWLQHRGRTDVLGTLADSGGSEAVVGFLVFDALPLGDLLVFLFLGLVVVFMVTSADVSTLVTALLATRRGLAPTTGSIVFWGTFQGAVAVSVLLLGGIETLQALAVLTGLPFAVLSVVALGGLTLTFVREEGGHTSLVGRLLAKLPSVGLHHDIDPPDEE